MADEEPRIRLSDDVAVSGRRSAPEAGKERGLFIYAPGAGANLHDPFGRYAARRLVEAGWSCARLQFPYMEAGRKRPDPTGLLEATWRAAIEQLAGASGTMVVGGRSMGGRIASQVTAAGAKVGGVALFAYPLHAPARPDQRRDAHLPAIEVPVLFCSGTRDAFARADELAVVAGKMRRASVHLLEHADHGFSVPAASGRKREDVWAEAVEGFLDWADKELLG